MTSKASLFFKIDPPTIQQFNEFKASCINGLEQNSSLLKEHRTVWGAFFSAIKQFFVALKALLFNEPIRPPFFNHQTASAKIVAELELNIKGLSIG